MGEDEDAYEYSYSFTSSQRSETRRPDELMMARGLPIVICLNWAIAQRDRLGGWVEIFKCFESGEKARMMQELSLIQTELKTEDDTTTKVVRRGENDDTERGSI